MAVDCTGRVSVVIEADYSVLLWCWPVRSAGVLVCGIRAVLEGRACLGVFVSVVGVSASFDHFRSRPLSRRTTA